MLVPIEIRRIRENQLTGEIERLEALGFKCVPLGKDTVDCFKEIEDYYIYHLLLTVVRG